MVARYLWTPLWCFDSFPLADLLYLFSDLSWRFFHIGIDALLHCCLCLMTVASWYSTLWIDHFFFSHFSPIGWSRRYEFRISLNLYTYTHRQLEFIALLCRVKEEKNKVDLCACIFTQTCRIFIPVCEFRGNGISLCMNYLYMIIYIAWAMRKVVLGKMVKILFFLERLDE